MEPVILDDIAFEVDMESLKKALRVREGSSSVATLQRLVSEALPIARPKALYGLAFIDSRDENRVVVDGETFTSRVLRINVEEVHRVFPFAATCGVELEEWANSIDDMLQRFWADRIMDLALVAARQTLDEHLQERFGLGGMSRMNPGSLPDWPLREQRPLFALLGDPEAAIGIRLTESLLMVPVKSVSGIAFATEVGFASCQLCPRGECPSRRAPYDRALHDTKYRQVEER
jgi:hypothetical protein